MTNEELSELDALCEQATPGPWRPDVPDHDGAPGVWQASSGGTICRINFDHQTGDHHPGPDMHFIAAARAALPALIAEVRKLRLELETSGRHRWIGDHA